MGKLYPHATETHSVYDYGKRIIEEGDLFDVKVADREFDGYTVEIRQWGPVVMIFVVEPEPELRKVWHIHCCEACANETMKAILKAQER